MTVVEAPSRLHFGLMSLPVAGREDWPDGLPVRLFGGAGLMITAPEVEVAVSPATEWAASGRGAERALAFGSRFSQSLPSAERRAFSIDVRRAPPEHHGLGSGTSLALSVAKAIAVELGHGDWSTVELAARVGRGERSAVGIHGFDRGGFIVEAGKLPGEPVAPLIGRYDFPSDWRIVLICLKGKSDWHGDKERRVFANLATNNTTETMCRIILTGVIPSLISENLRQFSEALHEFNLRAGSGFAAQQGGAWASPDIARVIGTLRAEGIPGVGQSSWGPSVFAIVGNEDHARAVAKTVADRLPMPAGSISITAAASGGFTAKNEASH